MPGGLVDGSELGEAARADDDLPTARDAATDDAGVPTLRYDAGVMTGADPDYLGDLAAVGRPHDGSAFGSVASGEVMFVRCAQLGFDKNVPVADHASKVLTKGIGCHDRSYADGA
jgi:hypothetical protein